MTGSDRTTRARRRRILVVCTGNVSRSPLAAGVLRSLLPAARFDVVSRGTRAPDRAPSDPVTIDVALAAGVDLSAHESHRLEVADLVDVDLVVTHERRHAEAIADLDPTVARRVIRLRQLSRVTTMVEPPTGTPRDRIAALLAARGLAAGDDLDIVDPVRRSAPEQRAIAEAIVADARRIAAALAD